MAEQEPGRLRTMWRIFQMTRKADPWTLPLMIAALVVPVALAVVLSVLLAPGNVLLIVLWTLAGLLVGVMLLMATLTWRAEKYAFSQIEGRAGAVGSVLASGLRGSWQSSEMPVAVNTKTQDAVYRAVGKPGVVLIAEGPHDRVQRLIGDEQRKIKRIVPTVPVHVLHIGPDSELPLRRMTRSMRRLKGTLTRTEVTAVANRLSSLGGLQMPIPKGMDPRKMRAGRPR